MARLRFSSWLWIAAALMALALAVPTAASPHQGLVFASRCHAATDLDRTADAMIEKRAWNCSDTGWKAGARVAWLRFEAESWRGEAVPRYFFSRTARHESITIHALDADGTLRSVSFAESDARAFAGGPVFCLPLPEITPATEAVFVRITATWLFALGLGFGLVGVWMGSTIDWITRAAILAVMHRRRARGEARPG